MTLKRTRMHLLNNKMSLNVTQNLEKRSRQQTDGGSGGAKVEKNQPCVRASRRLPEEGVVLDADLPQSLRGSVVGQLEPNGALELFVLMSGGRRRWCRWRRGGKKHKRMVKGVRGKVEVCGRREKCLIQSDAKESLLMFQCAGGANMRMNPGATPGRTWRLRTSRGR